MMNPYLMGIDIGTSSCKTAVFDADGRVVATGTHGELLSGAAGEQVALSYRRIVGRQLDDEPDEPTPTAGTTAAPDGAVAHQRARREEGAR